MKKVFLTLATFMAVGCLTLATAQIKTPAPSPGAKIIQTVGLTDITVEYSRPSMKGRTIFGGLVPYGEMWRTGANKNTMVTFSAPVNIAGKDLKAGTYALFTVPGQTEWEIIFYTDTENWGTPEKWDAAKEAVRFKAKAEKIDFGIESFMIDLGDLTNDGCVVGIGWEKTWVSFPIKLTTDEVVAASIKKTMAGPSADDYYSAGRYYFESGKDLKQAYEWLHKSNEMDTKFWKLRQESLVLAAMGKHKEAIATAEKSKAMAVEAGNKDYERMNTESISEWTKKM
ncbi:MAG: DUF2911 domain-containing protein [Saprospiraceae bacterium]|nr:DUF2911 domain-containing protein [Saprospiraceae bacterium]MCF8251492.1 DUF2911 domain-containing protein [Saprospiraceae bacterium]MCF8280742.1 DUF2911 domain-containing protein [Bacteroidales bacterium]MCF8313352.1 DUF2911 domain-containing protein [Saprospiraceae bacterium]MCF8441828.1 DUF2911 domain-containing protein [Saprospiraceae bacterium]